MNMWSNRAERPPLHIPAAESDLVAGLALSSEHRTPVVSAMLLEEIERAELHEPDTLPPGYARLNSIVTFIDQNTKKIREAQLVLPADADIAKARLSILTPMGAALYGLAADHTIEWPDLQGREREIRIVRVVQPNEETLSQ